MKLSGGVGAAATKDGIPQFKSSGKWMICALGAGLVAAFVKALLVRDIPIFLNSPAQRLVVKDNRITGLVASLNGSEKKIRVRNAVVLAAGGYEANPELVRSYEAFPE